MRLQKEEKKNLPINIKPSKWLVCIGKKRERKKAIEERRLFRGLQIIPTTSFYDESHGHKPGENNWTKFGFDLHPQVSLAAGGLVLLFIVLSVVFQEQSGKFFQYFLDGIGNSFGWLYVLASNFFVIVMLLLAASNFGKLRIGGPDALPEFSTGSWYAMLISAGMGIGLMFWSVAEPVFHYIAPSPMFEVPDHILLGVVDLLVALCGNVHSAYFQRAHRAGIYTGRDDIPFTAFFSLDVGLRWIRAMAPNYRNGRHCQCRQQ